MTSSTAVMLWLAITSAAAFNYQAVSKCPTFKGDKHFTLDSLYGVYREIYATTSIEDAATDRCVLINYNDFYVTRNDSSTSVLEFTSLTDIGNGTLTEIGPDGNSYKVIVIKTFPSCCSHMDLLVLCSDSVGSIKNPPLLMIQVEQGAQLNKICMNAAKRYVKAYMKTDLTLNVLPNTDCVLQPDVVPKGN